MEYIRHKDWLGSSRLAICMLVKITALSALLFIPVLTSSGSSSLIQVPLQHMTQEEKIGQLIMARVWASSQPENDNSEILSSIAQGHVGSIDLRVKVDSPNLLRADPRVIAEIVNTLQHRSPIPLLVGADIERGMVARSTHAPDFPNLMAVGAANDPALAREAGFITATEARALGIDWAFSPVADVSDDPNNPVIGDRAYGESANQVSRLVSAYIQGAHRGGLLVTAKHFPGHGDTDSDSHVGIVTLGQDEAHFKEIEFRPFEAAIASGADSIMLAHARVPALDADPSRIATTSPKIIEEILRSDLGFKGVVVTDALEMKGVIDLYKGNLHPEARAAVDAIKAGADVVMVSGDIEPTYRALLAAVKSGEINRSRLDQAAQRVLAMKLKARLFADRCVDVSKVDALFANPHDWKFAQDLADSAVTLVRDEAFPLPMELSGSGKRVVLVLFTDSIRSPLGKAFEDQFKARIPAAQVRHVYYDNRAGWEADDVVSAVESADEVIVGAFMTNLPGKKYVTGGKMVNVFGMNGLSAQLLEKILAAGEGKVMVVSLGSPYLIEHYSQISNYICTFSIASTSEIAVVKALFGELQNHASLPVTLPGIAKLGYAIPWPQPTNSRLEPKH